MEKEEITAVFRTHWRTGYGAVSPDEAIYIRDLIARDKPERFIEIGTGSGLSGGLCRTAGVFELLPILGQVIG